MDYYYFHITNILWSVVYYFLGILTGGIIVFAIMNSRKAGIPLKKSVVNLSIDKYT